MSIPAFAECAYAATVETFQPLGLQQPGRGSRRVTTVPVQHEDAVAATGAKIAHLGLLPQGQPERNKRALRMVAQVTQEQFGSCTNIGECEAVCPKGIRIEAIARMNRDFLAGSWTER